METNQQESTGDRTPLPCAEVEAQGRLVRLRVCHRPQRDWGRTLPVRGAITQFSRASRKRMLELLARIEIDRTGLPCFVTLTYPDREGPPALSATERDRQTLLKRIRRRFPLSSGLWRREFKARKSGEFVGVVFPHYHLLCFNLPFLPYEELNGIWCEVLRHEGYARTEIKAIDSWRQAIFYVAKYMAKVEQEAGAVAGGDGERAKPRDPAAASAARSLVYEAYLTAEGAAEREKIGRAWGVFNRKQLPMAERTVHHLPLGGWLDEARKLLAQEVWSGIALCYPGTGFTLFVDDAQEWSGVIRALQDDDPDNFNADGEHNPVPF